MATYLRSALDQLESEAVYVLREVAAQFERPALLFSGGKDSVVLAELACRAFYPAPMPFPLLHVDTGHNFPETLAYRDAFAARVGAHLVVRSVQDTIDRGSATDETGPGASRNAIQTVTLLEALRELKVDAAVGGGRRDEEKARAKERVFSHRDRFGQWHPRHQRPEVWNLFNGLKAAGEHFRVFPLSNWTELDIWHYVRREAIDLPMLYFAHRRRVVQRDGMLLTDHPCVSPQPAEPRQERLVRFRTIGDMTCTGALESAAGTVDEVISELAALPMTERGGRADDRRAEAAMEDRKRQGYF